MPGAISLSTSTRHKLQSSSELLQTTEQEYLNLRQQLLNLNTEISESLQMVENEAGVDFQELIRENHLSSLKVPPLCALSFRTDVLSSLPSG